MSSEPRPFPHPMFSSVHGSSALGTSFRQVWPRGWGSPYSWSPVYSYSFTPQTGRPRVCHPLSPAPRWRSSALGVMAEGTLPSPVSYSYRGSFKVSHRPRLLGPGSPPPLATHRVNVPCQEGQAENPRNCNDPYSMPIYRIGMSG